MDMLQAKIGAGEQVTYKDIRTLSPESVVLDYVCTGNSGRSPLAEAIAWDEIAELGLEEKIVAISSGTNRAVMDGRGPPLRLQYMVLERALNRNEELGLYDTREETKVKGLLKDKERTTAEYNQQGSLYDLMWEYESRARSQFVEEEHAFRQRAAKEIGLRTRIKTDGQQTIASDKILHLYAMAASNELTAREIYGDSDVKHRPTFHKFSIENTFGLPYSDYRAMVDILQAKVVDSVRTVAESLR